MTGSPWLLRKPGPRGPVTTFCFPYAGGNAAHYLGWQGQLSRHVDICAIQLPGRGWRMREPVVTQMEPLVSTLADIIEAHARQPFAFYGHSMGALVAFEVARRLAAKGAPLPKALLLSGCEAPQVRRPHRRVHDLADAELIAELQKYEGSPPEALANRELMALAMPGIRADFAILESYRYQPGPLLQLPLCVFSGAKDDYVKGGRAAGWERETTGSCEHHTFAGGHFFINSERAEFLALLEARLAALA